MTNQWKKDVAERFDGIADMWLQRGVTDPTRLAPIIEELNCEPDSLILDAGCGSGNWSAALALHGYRVRGFDISPKMIENAQVRAQELNLDTEKVQYQVGDAENVAFPDATFVAGILAGVKTGQTFGDDKLGGIFAGKTLLVETLFAGRKKPDQFGWQPHPALGNGRNLEKARLEYLKRYAGFLANFRRFAKPLRECCHRPYRQNSADVHSQ
jgi:hypothetical protein